MSSSITKNEPLLETTDSLKGPGEGTVSKSVKRKGSEDASPKRSKKKAKTCSRVKLSKDSVDSMICETFSEIGITSKKKRADVVKVGPKQDAVEYSESDKTAVGFDSEQKFAIPESPAVEREQVELPTFSSSSTLVSSSSTLVEDRVSLVTN